MRFGKNNAIWGKIISSITVVSMANRNGKAPSKMLSRGIGLGP